MKLFKYLIGIMAVATLVGCEIPEEESKTEYPELTNIVDTLWYSYDQKNFIYYDIEYNEATGTMKGYKDQERTEELSNRAFSYTFTPATEQYDAIVELSFDDGQRYGGMLIPKGNLQISNKDVYMIQLYEINDKGAIIYDENGDIKSTILMWKE
ncbi:MAG: hypothetical protein J6Q36_05035 [Alistipes sp.]|nr:hypothetical protein [Alistipes sp.]